MIAGGLSAGALPLAVGSQPAAAADATPWTAPVRPALCTPAQAASGNVVGCLLDGPEGLPDARGWPATPFPDASGATAFAAVAAGRA